ncbi:hypothetical protein HOP52_10410 [Halomonas campisalis]|uniref:Uncharacterized protein n=1 Tax=Billgrantia campisalis TaxID=74661 RepID=A0ABS9P951_9GAMM|nr:hypothetical protein [Halomonas campisalis]MCG6658166.1 hypothetical protein [Halomonas campisalis]MDR5862835.1 hypothetical protein [Halomonas campisalis]
MKDSLSRKLLMPALLAVAIAPLALSATAGEKDDKGWHEQRQERFEAHREALFERAGLDEATRSALEEAHAEHHEALRELHDQHRQRMDEILDDDQRQALRAAKQELHQEKRSAYGAKQRGSLQQRLTALVDSWELSDEEREALRETREALYADMAELRGQSFDSRDERREAWQALRDEHHAALAELLTEEQIGALEAAMPSRGHKGAGKAKYRSGQPYGD